jgi:hypothetical protein
MATFHRPGIYRRRLQITTEPGRAIALLEDDPHCYRVTIDHDGEHITAAHADTIRIPWTACRQASHQLDRLVGLPLDGSAPGVRQLTDSSQQCTHMLDTAVLAIAHAARGIAQRRYDVSVECFDMDAPQRVQVLVDGAIAFEGAVAMAIRDTRSHIEFVAPDDMRGVSVKGLYAWAQTRFSDEDRREMMWVLRRALYVSGSRTHDLDERTFAVELNPGFGACYVYQPGIAENARRVPGMTRDLTDPANLAGWEAVRIVPPR